uniref:Uncharacterized protein n=1 Tax=Romanomermis culicivorax TaxID=13658 RepID=A0A915HNJ0_ROMCU
YNDFLYNKVLRSNYPTLFNIISWRSRRRTKNSTAPDGGERDSKSFGIGGESTIVWRKGDDRRRGVPIVSTTTPSSPLLLLGEESPLNNVNETSAFLATPSSTLVDFNLTATKKDVAAGRKVIVEYRLPPGASQDLLESMWNSVHRA